MTLLKKPLENDRSPRDSFVSTASHSRSTSSAQAPPPAYDGQQEAGSSNVEPALPSDFTARLESLTIDPLPRQGVPAPHECIAHLKLLEAFHNLRQDIESTHGLFGIASPTIPSPPTSHEEALEQKIETKHDDLDEGAEHKIKQVREKRWAVYVSRAVERYEKWFADCVPKLTAGKSKGPLTGHALLEEPMLHEAAGLMGERLNDFFPANLPPLDVLMVWHSHTLNPRIFFEDCLRYGAMDFWATGLPWASINACIDNTTFEYDVDGLVKAAWISSSGLSWDNLDDPPERRLRCPCCTQATFLSVPWSRNAGFRCSSGASFVPGDGYADRDFAEQCPNCKRTITCDMLQVHRFRQDISRLLMEDVPLGGTILDHQGRPPCRTSRTQLSPPTLFASVWIKDGVHVKLLKATDLRRDHSANLDTVRLVLEEVLSDRKLGSTRRKGSGPGHTPTVRERVSVRRMMSRYWDNRSIFGIDLVGAVVRQGTFIEKMHNIGWLFSPALYSTAARLVTKYSNFFKIMALFPSEMAVPTLDVDLAWHTHQTSPSSYYSYSVATCHGVFIDHDDKVEEAKLDESFEWTSKIYQRIFRQPYSECTCWYCEAVRESHTSSLSRLFKMGNATASASLHNDDAAATSDDPHAGPHISSHNSVRTNNSFAWSAARRAHLEKAYAAAVRRAKKDGRAPPEREKYYVAKGRELDEKKNREAAGGYYYPYAAACAPFVGYAYAGAYPLGAAGYAGGDPGDFLTVLCAYNLRLHSLFLFWHENRQHHLRA
ncbi:hypothetical protein MPH_09858 [Macrophomina phaseolina MS6]|uniref:Uncharacterized protein n=1 Tax=Macrophomina phaseolina (strain MS6) TaxID=1126212 RepID=K2REP2_MACPH|nr:hypothetical protein MPH_09858 [Macrophomina phaseolina MS6]